MSLASQTNRHEVTVKTHTSTRGAGGAPIRSESTVGTKRGFIQPLFSRDIAELRKEGIETTHVMYFSKDPELTSDHFLEYDDNGTTRTFKVEGHFNTCFLGRLWRVELSERKDVDNT